MRKILENSITILVAAISLPLCIWWYSMAPEPEPIIGMVAASGALLTGLVYRFFPEKSEPETPGTAPINLDKQQSEINMADSKNAVVNSNISAGGDVHIGDKTIVNNQGANIENQFNGGTFNNTTFN